MTRGTLLLCGLLMFGCGRSERDLRSLLPQQVDGGWSRADVQPLHASDLPADITGMPWTNAVIARYRGPAAVNTRLIEMKSETVAFELMQRWRQSEGLAFYKGPLFVVCRPDGATPEQLSQFTRALQNAMAKQG